MCGKGIWKHWCLTMNSASMKVLMLPRRYAYILSRDSLLLLLFMYNSCRLTVWHVIHLFFIVMWVFFRKKPACYWFPAECSLQYNANAKLTEKYTYTSKIRNSATLQKKKAPYWTSHARFSLWFHVYEYQDRESILGKLDVTQSTF